MSQPPAPASTYPNYPAASSADAPATTMADTQTLPSFPPPFFEPASSVSRRLPQPIQLPPLTIPQQRVDYHPVTTQHHATSQGPPTAAPRPAPRAYGSEQAAPLSKVLSPHPYTPPRSEAAYSPSSPPRSAIDLGSQLLHRRAISDYDGHRHQVPEPPYLSPVDHRHPYGALPSPASNYAPQYPGSQQVYRHPAPPHLSHQIPPPSSYPSSGYHHDHGPAPPPPRIAPSVPPPQIHPQQTPYSTQRDDYQGKNYVPQKDSELNYELKVRQQPIAARACGFGERDRRVIDPPPIIQLMVTDAQTRTVDLDELRYSLNVVHCTLWNADGTHEETALVQPDRRATRRLMGQLVASPSVAKDEHDNEGCFFCFPDLSCRTHGRYRLRFILMRIDPMKLQVGDSSPILTEVLSDPFTVYTAKDFPGMRPSSALTRALKLQGCNIQVKKGNEKALSRKRSAISNDDDEDVGDKGGGKKLRK